MYSDSLLETELTFVNFEGNRFQLESRRGEERKDAVRKQEWSLTWNCLYEMCFFPRKLPCATGPQSQELWRLDKPTCRGLCLAHLAQELPALH